MFIDAFEPVLCANIVINEISETNNQKVNHIKFCGIKIDWRIFVCAEQFPIFTIYINRFFS